MILRPFKPLFNVLASGAMLTAAPLNVSASTAATPGALPVAIVGSENVSIRVFNQTSSIAYLLFGTTTAAVTTTPATASNSIAMLPNSVEVFDVDGSVGAVSVLLANGTGTVQFVRGQGL
jgi:hypothetical protein